jgi:hypothetical protein
MPAAAVSYKYSENEGNPYLKKRDGAADGTLVKSRPQHRMDCCDVAFYLDVKLHCVTEKASKLLAVEASMQRWCGKCCESA